jgi:transposase
MTSLQISQKQNTDLRIRNNNLKAKLEIAELEAKKATLEYTAALREKDKIIDMLQREVVKADKENADLVAEVKSLKSSLEEALDKVGKYLLMLKKDSSTSSKPPSTDGIKKLKTVSTREKSGKKVGGQPGHPGHTLKQFSNPTAIVEKLPPLLCECGGHVVLSDEYIAKQLADIRTALEIIEERVLKGYCEDCGKMYTGTFSEAFVNPVQYGNNIRTMVVFLNAHTNATMNKTADFINSMANDKLHITDGTIAAIPKSFAACLGDVIEVIKANLINGGALNADETGCRVNGGLDWAQIFSNNKWTLFSHNKKRGDVTVEGFDLLELFTGILSHDHFKTYYRYKNMTHAECNAHILRYLKAVIDILKHQWASDMSGLLREANRLKKQCIKEGKSALASAELERIQERYHEIIGNAEAEYAKAIDGKKNISYYNEERLLIKRLGEYADEHLRFLTNFDAPFDNNGAEQGARFFKGKVKTAGCFRSDAGADAYARIASFISTLKKQDMNVFSNIRDVLDGITPVFADCADSG